MKETEIILLKENVEGTIDGLCRIREQLELLGQSLEREILSIDAGFHALEKAGAVELIGLESEDED